MVKDCTPHETELYHIYSPDVRPRTSLRPSNRTSGDAEARPQHAANAQASLSDPYLAFLGREEPRG
jgi:hypothetical protein